MLLFCCVSAASDDAPSVGGDVGLGAPLKRLLGGEGTFLGRSCGVTLGLFGCANVLWYCSGVLVTSGSEFSALELDAAPASKAGACLRELRGLACLPRGLVLRARQVADSGLSLVLSRVLFERLMPLEVSVRSPMNEEEYGERTLLPSEYGVSSSVEVLPLNGLRGSANGRLASGETGVVGWEGGGPGGGGGTGLGRPKSSDL